MNMKRFTQIIKNIIIAILFIAVILQAIHLEYNIIQIALVIAYVVVISFGIHFIIECIIDLTKDDDNK